MDEGINPLKLPTWLKNSFLSWWHHFRDLTDYTIQHESEYWKNTQTDSLYIINKIKMYFWFYRKHYPGIPKKQLFLKSIKGMPLKRTRSTSNMPVSHREVIDVESSHRSGDKLFQLIKISAVHRCSIFAR